MYYETHCICTPFFNQNMELSSDGKKRIKGSSCRVRDPNPLCFWAVPLLPLKVTLHSEVKSKTDRFWSNFHIFIDDNKFRNPSRPYISNSGADSNTGKQGELFIVHFTSEADGSRVSIHFRAICSLLSDLVTLLVKAGKAQSCILPSQQILAGSSGEEWSHSFPLPQFLFYKDFSFSLKGHR